MPYRDYFHDFVTKLLLRSNSLRNHESSPPLFGAGPRAHLTARGGKSGVWASGAMEKQFRESGQWAIGLIIWAFCWKRGN